MSRSLFQLKNKDTDLSVANSYDVMYQQIAPTRDVTGDNFPNGSIHFKWNISGIKWMNLKRSYLRFRLRIDAGDGVSPIATGNGVAPAMGLVANMFQSMEFKINGTVVSRIADFVPQIDMLKKRSENSKSWLDSQGRDTNFYSAKFWERASRTSGAVTVGKDALFIRQSYAADDVAAGDANWWNPTHVFDYATPNQIQITDTNRLIFTANNGLAIPDLKKYFNIGDTVKIDDGANKTRKIVGFDSTVTQNDTIIVGGAALTAVAAADMDDDQFLVSRPNIVAYENLNKNYVNFEVIWQPPLSIWDVKHALPVGDYELVLNPKNSSSYKIGCFESVTEAVVINTAANGGVANINVDDLYLYLSIMDGPRVESLSYYMDLTEIQCQKRVVQASTGLLQEEFTVSPATFAIATAFQNTASGSSTGYSLSRFTVGLPFKDPRPDLKLTRLYINYLSKNKPQPDADPSYDEATGSSRMLQRYVDTTMYNGSYFSHGGGESYEDWLMRGPYYMFVFGKESTDRSTRVYTSYQFSQALEGGSQLLFSLSRRAAMVKIENGMVVAVSESEM